MQELCSAEKESEGSFGPSDDTSPLHNQFIGITISGENPVCATTRITTNC